MHLIPNTFGIDAKCAKLLEFSTVEELKEHFAEISEARRQGKLLIIGRGSNLLPICDFDGLVVRSRIDTMGFVALENSPKFIDLSCGSGLYVDDVIDFCVQNGFCGMENLSYIPGEVGASAVQNIGAYGAEAKDVIKRIHALDLETGKMVDILNADCDYAYRWSRFKGEWKNRFIITHVTYHLSTTFTPRLDYGNIRAVLQEKGIPENDVTPRQLRDCIVEIRKAKLPDYHIEGNAGSFFMNPVVSQEKVDELLAQYPGMPHYPVPVAGGESPKGAKIPAGWMIDKCGWKGKSIGNAGVHSKQALVLVNKGGATGQEILNLCRRIQDDVLQKFGIEIHPEVNFLL